MKIKGFFKTFGEFYHAQRFEDNTTSPGAKGFFESLITGWEGATDQTSLASLSLGKFLGIAGGLAVVAVLIKGVYDWTNRLNTAMERTAEAHSEYLDAANELKSLNGELETTQEKIAELQSYDTLSLANEAELEKLRAQNDELERQIQLKEKEVEQKNNQAIAEVRETLELKATKDLTNELPAYERDDFGVVIDGGTVYGETDILTATQNEITKLTELKQQRKTLLEENKEENDSLLSNLEAEIREYETAISENISKINTLRDSFLDTNGLVLDSLSYSDKSLYNALTKVIDNWANIDLSPIQKAYKNLENFFKTSGNSDFKETFHMFDEIESEIQKISDWGLDEYADNILRRTLDPVFGNVNMDNRALITWTEEQVEASKEALKAIITADGNYYDQLISAVQEGAEAYDTVLGASLQGIEGFKGITDIAFSQIVNNSDGTFEVLGNQTAEEYIYGILEAAQAQGDLSIDHILELDKQGVKNAKIYNDQGKVIGQTYIHGIIAGFNEEADVTSMLMHFAGEYGAIEIAYKNIDKAAKKAGVSSKNLINLLKQSKGTGEALKSTMNQMDITLDDMGIDSIEMLQLYLADTTSSVYDAIRALDVLRLSVSDVEEAFETENRGANYEKMVDLLKQANELYTNGLIGTDEFQTSAQWILPNVIDTSEYKNDSVAYKEAWEKAYNKVQSWFDEDNPVKSMWNFTDQLYKDGSKLFSVYDKKQGYIEWADSFTSTAQAAEALDVNVSVVDTMFKRLEDYGLQLGDNFKYSGELLDDYKSNLDGVADIMEDLEGTEKDRLQTLVDNWNKEYLGFEADLSTLDEKKIIEIEFEYSLAQIEAEIQKLQEAANEGDSTVLSSLNAKKAEKISKLEGKTGYTEDKDTGLAQAKTKVESLQAQFNNENLTEEARNGIKKTISAIYDLEIAYQEFRKDGGKLNWEDYLNTTQANDVFEEIVKETGKTREEILKMFNLEVKPQEIALEGKVYPEQIQREIDKLPKDSIITFQAELDGVETEVTAELDKEGKITYHIEKDGEITEVDLNKDGTISYKPDITQVTKEITPQKVNKTGTIKYVADFLGLELPPVLTGVVKYEYTGAYNKAQKAPVIEEHAYADGTAFNVINTRPISAYGNGSAALSANETALVNELGTESIVRDGKWMLIPGGMHRQALKKGDIVINAQQTKDLLEHGKANGYANAYASGTLGAYTLSNARASTNVYLPTASNNYKYNSTGKSSSSSSSSSNSSDKSEEEIDWIETKISRIERDISNLDKTVQATYKTWSTRNTALTKELSKVNNEITIQQQAYDRYIKQANSVGLSSKYKTLVQNGKIDIETITDENLKEKIDEYTTWYEKALACKDAIIDLNDNLADLAKQRFDGVVTQFENLLSSIEHSASMIEGSIDIIEAKGYVVSTKMYEQLQSSQLESLEQLKKEYTSLNTALSTAMKEGKIEKYSDDWYDMMSSIQDTDKAIQDMNKSLIETDNAIREIKWDLFDKMQEGLSSVTNESDWLIDILSNDKMFDADSAELTKEGQATFGLHSVNYNTYMSQAKKYADELRQINAQLANDPYNTTLLERRQELLEAQRDSISAAEDEKQAIKDLVSEGYDTFLDVMNKIIDKYKERLDTVKDLYDYEKDVSEILDEISKLEKQRLAYSKDNSEEGMLKQQQIEVALKEAQENLQETEYDRWKNDQTAMLDKIYDDTEEFLNSRLDQINELVQGVIDSTNINAESIRNTLSEKSDSIGYTLSDTMKSIWSPSGETNGQVVSTIVSALTSTNAALNQIVAYVSKLPSVNDTVKTETKPSSSNSNNGNTTTSSTTNNTNTNKPSTSSTSSSKTIKVGGKINAGSAMIYDYAGDKTGETQYYKNDPIYNVLDEKNGYIKVRHHKLSSGVTGWFKKNDVKAYKTGGLLDETGLFWGDGTKSAPELVLNAKDTENFIELKDTLRNIDVSLLEEQLQRINNIKSGLVGNAAQQNWSNYLSRFAAQQINKIPENVLATEHSMVQNYNLKIGDIVLEEVQNPQQLAQQINNIIRSNQQTEKLIEAMTIGTMMGGNKYNKMKY